MPDLLTFAGLGGGLLVFAVAYLAGKRPAPVYVPPRPRPLTVGRLVTVSGRGCGWVRHLAIEKGRVKVSVELNDGTWAVADRADVTAVFG